MVSDTYFPSFFRCLTHSVRRYSICPLTDRKSSSAHDASAAYNFVESRRGICFFLASAIIDARKMIVDGAVGMVEMALERLNEGELVELDEERKAAMVSNLLVVLCGNHDAQPIVNTGSLY